MTDQTMNATTSAASVRDYFELMKPRIMMLVVFTAAAGLVAAPSGIHWLTGAAALLAVALGSGAAGAINMWYDADIDAVMTRTSTRPLPAGRVQASDALSLGIFMSIMSVIIMTLATNWQAGALLAFSIFFYGVIYTMWLKRSTHQNIVIGGAAGAFPPVIGWAAVTGTMPVEAWALFLITFMWTPPHFWALSLVANKDYEKAGVPMLPVVKGASNTRLQILIYTIMLLPVTLLPTAFGTGGYIYTAIAAVGGVVFLGFALKVFASKAGDPEMEAKDRKLALGMFAFSILYLALLFGALIVEHGFGLYFSSPNLAIWAGV
ncbi:heme o synthase [Ponticaulis sp.]|uniref:heme o synthase n=1 Tax=Ponticaulis sp. TaxID=2020902 RepID=UPI000B7544D5|nr:heme o synthase [Ponticaulis sp.]MAJ08739.1 protoheme IX farnesyltransferase [Ponticaulis sp.]RPG17438.1 MAG: protoheme IX farnesyltransferase [Hyphomonadaceae bacterium TMED125]